MPDRPPPIPWTREDTAREIERHGIRGTLERYGITDETLAAELKAELEAKETKFFAFRGKVVEERDVVAWDVRQRARQNAHELRGDYPKVQEERSALPLPPINLYLLFGPGGQMVEQVGTRTVEIGPDKGGEGTF